MGQTAGKISRRNPASCPGPNNLPPLQFHSVHGDNIRISRDGLMARRLESFCRAITFSARPVRINERVCVKFSEVSNNWNGGIRFGFTSNDPVTLESALPKYACPDLTNRPGFWAKALHEQYCEKGNVLFYYVNSSGDVVYGINDEEKGVILNGIDTRGLLWTLIDVYGNCTAIELLDSRIYMYQSATTPGYLRSNSRRSLPDNEMDRVLPSMQSLSLSDEVGTATTGSNAQLQSNCIPPIRYNAGGCLIPVPFHLTKGRNVRLSQDRFIATRTETDFCQGYVFTARPIRIGEKIIVQILKTEHMYVGALALGLTSCNPASLQPSDLPDDSDFLLDRPEYWVVSKDIASTPQKADEIAFCVTPSGEVTISKNDGPAVVVMHVDQSLQLWAFLDVYGSTQSVRVFQQPPANMIAMAQQQQQQQQHILAQHNPSICISAGQQITQTSPRRLQVTLPLTSSESYNSINSQISESRKMSGPASLGGTSVATATTTLITPMAANVAGTASTATTAIPAVAVTTPVATASCAAVPGNVATTSNGRLVSVPSNGDMIQIQPGGTVLVVNLPPTHGEVIPAQLTTNQGTRISQIPLSTPGSSATMLSTCSNAYIEPVSSSTSGSNCGTYNALNQFKDSHRNADSNSGAECTICYENPIDSVLYMCGHMCMCYECAIEQWRGVGGGHCPLCRAVIRDVIRTYTT